jgi:hypothetical protein
MMGSETSGPLAWADRITRQSEQMVALANGADGEMRDELLGFARRLVDQSDAIRRNAICRPDRE